MSQADLLHADAPESAEDAAPEIEGTLPAAIDGTFLRIGPGRQHAGNDRFHLLDGYGYVAGLTFGAGRVRLRARHVETSLYKQETAAGKQLRRKVFTNKPSRWSNLGDVNLPNVAAHDVFHWAGRLFATDTPGYVALDEKTLETKGKSPVDAYKTSALANLCQMPRVDPATGRLVVFSVQPTLTGDVVTFREFDGAWKVVAEKSQSLGGRGVVLHDLCFTKTHYLALEIGRLDVLGAAWGAKTVFECIGPGPRGHRVIGVPRTPDAKPFEAVLPGRRQPFHFFNAFDRDGKVIVDTFAYDKVIDFRPLNAPSMRVPDADKAAVGMALRLVIDPATGALEQREYGNFGTDAPIVRADLFGKPSRFGYGATTSEVHGDEHASGVYFYAHSIGKLDFDTGAHTHWRAAPTTFVSPPAFVPDPAGTSEDAGWLLTWALDAEKKRTSVVVLDAKQPDAGPVAQVHLKLALPGVSHTEYVPGLHLA